MMSILIVVQIQLYKGPNVFAYPVVVNIHLVYILYN